MKFSTEFMSIGTYQNRFQYQENRLHVQNVEVLKFRPENGCFIFVKIQAAVILIDVMFILNAVPAAMYLGLELWFLRQCGRNLVRKVSIGGKREKYWIGMIKL
jgi:hypothetical protein